MNQYETFMRHVYTTGVNKADRTGTGTRSVFGHQMRFDLAQGFPLITTKKLHTRSIFAGRLCGLVEWIFGKQNWSTQFHRDIGFIFYYQRREPSFL